MKSQKQPCFKKKAMLKLLAAAIPLTFANAAHSSIVTFNNNFTMLSSAGGFVGDSNTVTFSWDGTFNTDPNTAINNATLSSPDTFFGYNWTAHDIKIYGAGSYTTGGYSFTVGSGQFGIQMLVDWGGTTNMSIVELAAPGLFSTTGSTFWDAASIDGDGDGIAGIALNNGPFKTFNVNFNLMGLYDNGNQPPPPPPPSTLENTGTITLSGGSWSNMNGSLLNNGLIQGYGTISGNNGFTNNGIITQNGGNLTLAVAGMSLNNGTINLAQNYQFILGSTTTLSNAGTINLNNGTISGAGILTNSTGGTISGNGNIYSQFSNDGGLLHVTGNTYISNSFNNSGIIRLSGSAANLSGGQINNSGRIEGAGYIGNSINNTGIIEAQNGTLTLGGYVQNNVGGEIIATAGSTIISNLNSNSGKITLAGGTLQGSSYTYLNNYGEISGFGSLQFYNLTNLGNVNLISGNHTINQLVLGSYWGSNLNTFTLGGGTLTSDYAYMYSGSTLNLTGGILNANYFSMYGGTINGNFQNNGAFYYNGGDINGTFTNNGSLSLNANFTSNGLENNSTISINNAQIITLNGNGLTNNGSMTIAGGKLTGQGTLTNNGFISGQGTIGGSGGFVNLGLVSLNGGNLVLSNTGANLNLGNIDLVTGYQFKLDGANLTNSGSINMNGGIISGTGALSNSYGGVISGRGTILSSLNNNGGTVVASGGALNIVSGFTNHGLVQVGGSGSSLVGGQIHNSGTIEGYGSIGNNIHNQGVIEARNGTLTLGGTITNAVGGQISAGTGNKVLVTGNMASNAGLINLAGGSFSTNGQTLSNNGHIVGYGVVSTGGLSNTGNMTLTGGTTTVNGNVTNGASGKIEIAHNPAIFTGDVVNNGVFKLTNTNVTFAGTYTENGAFISDPSVSNFTNMVIGSGGYLVGGAGDEWHITGNFENHSLQNVLWSTMDASLFLDGSGVKNLYLASMDKGAILSGFANNFAWGTFSLASGATLNIADGNDDAGAALYVGLFELGDGLTQLSNIHSSYNIYYNVSLAGNSWLNGQTYALNGGGQLMAASAVPVPPALWLLGSGLLGLLGMARRRQ